MSDQKNIDNLFREAFKDFEATPDPALWDKISSQLDEKTPQIKKKKKGIAFLPWFRIAGIAAALLLLFVVGNQFFDDGENTLNPDSQTTSTSKENTNSNSNTDINNSENNSDTQITGADTNTEKQSLQNDNDSENNVFDQKERIANESNDTNVKTKNNLEKSTQKGNALQNAVATQENKTNLNTVSQQSSNNTNSSNSIKKNTTITTENAVATTNSNVSNATKNNNSDTYKNSNTTQNNTNIKNEKYSNTVAENTKNNTRKGVNSSAAAETKNTQETVNTTAVAQNDANNGTKSTDTNSTNEATSTTAIDTTKEAVATTDTVDEKKDEIKKSLLDVINDLHALEKDSTAVAEVNPKRWTIAPNASPVYYNSLVNGSPIAETFADNTKTGDVNLSFGINVGYDVSSRLTVRAGIHKVDYSYSTQDVAIVPSINTGAVQATNGGLGTNSISDDITTIAFTQNASTYSLRDKQVSNNEFAPTILDSSIRQAQIEGNLNQRMSYLEVPIELKYAVIDKKIGVNVIGGVSTLLLTENSIVLDSPALTTELGEATNLNDVSFSTNIGIGIDYKLSNQLEFNLEPMLKYQLNTFSGNTGNFKPYSVGVYTGVSFRF